MVRFGVNYGQMISAARLQLLRFRTTRRLARGPTRDIIFAQDVLTVSIPAQGDRQAVEGSKIANLPYSG
jgi:hypothetical protein